MAEPDATIRAAGQYVEVIDPRNKLHGKRGVVQFFVGDNIYVKFADLRWARIRMFFPDQLRCSTAARELPAGTSIVPRKRRIALPKRGV